MTDETETQGNDAPLYSHHIFIFPFKWDHLPAGKALSDTSYASRTDLGALKRVMENREEWELSSFQILEDQEDQYHTFNEYNYFYEFARDALAIELDDQKTALRYSYPLADGSHTYYDLTTKAFADKNPGEVEYRLLVKDILLTIYDTGIGFMAFSLENRVTKLPKDILRINDFGRRIYPQYLGLPYQKDDGTWSSRIEPTQDSFLAHSITLTIGSREITEDFDYFNNTEGLNGNPISLPAHINDLLGGHFATVTKESVQRKSKPYILLSPVIDDRMFVLSFYVEQSIMEQMEQFQETTQSYSYLNNDFWYAYVFVDPSEDITCKSRTLQRALMEKHTYDRWLENKDDKGTSTGHLFGISRYSFMLLANPCWFTNNVLLNHFRYLYFQMSALALMQRASILRFAKEAARISRLVNEGQDKKWQKKQIREVYAAYLNFTNKVYFREITPQEQGIELYDKLRSAMEIDADLLALQREIDELHRYALLLEGEKSSREAELLSRIAAIFLPATLIASIFGFSNFPPDYPFWNTFWFWLALAIAIPAAGSVLLFLLRYIRK